jgi:hypothetical protein
MITEVIAILCLLYLAFWYFRTRSKRSEAANWKLTNATIERVQLEMRGHYTPVFVADVSYSYCVDESRFGGTVSVPATWWSREPSSALTGTEIQLRVHPTNPTESVVISATLPGIDRSVAPSLLIQGANQ